MTGNAMLLIVNLEVAMFESESEPPIHDAHCLLQRAAAHGLCCMLMYKKYGGRIMAGGRRCEEPFT